MGGNVEGVDRTAARQVAGYAVDHGDVVEGEAGNWLAEGGRYRDRSIQPQLHLGAQGHGDAGDGLPDRDPRCAAALGAGRHAGGDARQQGQGQKGEDRFQESCQLTSRGVGGWHFGRPVQNREKATEMAPAA